MASRLPFFTSLIGVLLAVDPASAQVGADVPWVSYHAVDGSSDGEKLSSRLPTEIANEAVKRQCVKLIEVGRYVEWKVAKPANAIVIRNSVPDAPEGGGASFTISLAVNGKFRQKLKLSSHHSWLYGKEPNPQKNSPDEGAAHVFFDETRALLEGPPLVAGDKVRIFKDKTDLAPWYAIDLIDLEDVAPPSKMPRGFLSVLDFGAVPDDGKDDSVALKECVEKAKAEGKGVWIPEGTFHQSEALVVNKVRVRGAGPWYTRLTSVGLPKPKDFSGNMGIRLAGTEIEVTDLSIDGILTVRGGTYQQHGLSTSRNAPDGFRVENVWVEHTNTGGWLGPCSNGLIRGCRFRNTYADGLNINQNSHDVIVEHNHWRGNGDDSIALLSNVEHKGIDGACRDMIIRRNTVEGTWWGNGIAVYGGSKILVERNLIVGTSRGPGLLLSTGFKSWPGDDIRVSHNVLLDCSGSMQNQNWGAMHIYLPGKDLSGVSIHGNTVRRATGDAFKIHGGANPGAVAATLAGNLFDAPGGNGIHALASARGGLSLMGNRFTGLPEGKVIALNDASKFVAFDTIGPHGGGQSQVTFSRDGRRLATANPSKIGPKVGMEVTLFDCDTPKVIMVTWPSTVAAISFSDDGKVLTVRETDGKTGTYSSADGKVLTFPKGK